MIKRQSTLHQCNSQGGGKAERWLVSYADFITLLFAFFVLMYASSTLNQQKYQNLIQTLSQQFKSVPPIKKPSEQTGINQSGESIESVISAPIPKWVETTQALNQMSFLKEPGYAFAYQTDWFELELKASTLFESGSVTLTQAAKTRLDEVIMHLRDTPFKLIVEGYTDNQPVASNPFYASNWALSSERAAAVVAHFVQQGIDPERLLVVGYGERFPLDPTQGTVHQTRNRRVVIVGVTQLHAAARVFRPERTLLKGLKESKASQESQERST